MQKKRVMLLAILVLAASIAALLAWRIIENRASASAQPREFAPVSAAADETTLSPAQRWPLLLVNKSHSVPAGYTPPLLTLANGQKIDARIYPDLQDLFDAARQAGFSLSAAYCYRTKQQQREILNARIAQHLKEGATAAQAKKKALEYVARPGHSEHELGLALDIHAEGNTKPEALFVWLQANAYRFGFIERYPEDKTEITGISYERWHYRYVGKTAAAVMFAEHWTLEEYLQAGAFDRSAADVTAAETTEPDLTAALDTAPSAAA